MRREAQGCGLAHSGRGPRRTKTTEQEALFEIEGPDEDSFVWLVSGEVETCHCSEPRAARKVAEKLANWLAGSPFSEASSESKKMHSGDAILDIDGSQTEKL